MFPIESRPSSQRQSKNNIHNGAVHHVGGVDLPRGVWHRQHSLVSGAAVAGELVGTLKEEGGLGEKKEDTLGAVVVVAAIVVSSFQARTNSKLLIRPSCPSPAVGPPLRSVWKKWNAKRNRKRNDNNSYKGGNNCRVIPASSNTPHSDCRRVSHRRVHRRRSSMLPRSDDVNR